MVAKGALTDLEHQILALVGDGSRTGYAIRKALAATQGRRWSDQSGSIYRALHRLVQSGLLELVTEGDRTRNRREYVVSKVGRETIIDWIASEQSQENPTIGYLITRFSYLRQAPTEEAKRTMRLWLERSQKAAKALRTELARSQADPYEKLVLLGRVEQAESVRRWLTAALDTLNQPEFAVVEGAAEVIRS